MTADAEPASVRSLLTPRWLAAHAVVLLVTVVFVALGLWQLDRRDELAAHNEVVSSRLAQEPVPLETLDLRDPSAVYWRRVVLQGEYVRDEEVLVRNRRHGAVNGVWVVTPLALDADTGVLVIRGSAPRTVETPGAEAVAPPTGAVTVEGIVLPSEDPPSIGARDPEEGQLDVVFRADVARLDRQTSVDLLPVLVQVTTQDPSQPNDLPRPAPEPEVEAGPHLSYALQWFSFAIILLVGYGAWIRRRLHDERDQTRRRPSAPSVTGPR